MIFRDIIKRIFRRRQKVYCEDCIHFITYLTGDRFDCKVTLDDNYDYISRNSKKYVRLNPIIDNKRGNCKYYKGKA